MSIIVEGPDGTGKTTLISKLLRDFPQLNLHPKFVGSDMSGRDTMLRKVWAAVNHQQATDLYDRHPMISEFVMTPVLGRDLPPGFLHPSTRGVRHQALSDSLTILCLPPYHRVRDSVFAGKEHQPEEVKWHLTGLYQAYRMLLVTHPYPEQLYVYDYTNPFSTENLYDVITAYLKEHA